MNRLDRSSIIVVNNIDEKINYLKANLSNLFIVKPDNSSSEFLLEHSKKAIYEAYIATENKKYIALCANSFRLEAQNSLLKIIEEPPKDVIFIIITTSKSSILPTIISRMNIIYEKKEKIELKFGLDINKFNLKDIYLFLKNNKYISKQDAKELIYEILYIFQKNNIYLDSKKIELFSKSIKLLELNSKPENVLTNLLFRLI